jgi:hypothetical protein
VLLCRASARFTAARGRSPAILGDQHVGSYQARHPPPRLPRPALESRVDALGLAFEHEAAEHLTIDEQIVLGHDQMVGLPMPFQRQNIGSIQSQTPQASRVSR